MPWLIVIKLSISCTRWHGELYGWGRISDTNRRWQQAHLFNSTIFWSHIHFCVWNMFASVFSHRCVQVHKCESQSTTLDTVLQALWTSFIYLLRQAWNFVWNFCLADQPAPPQHWADHKYRITPHLLLHGLWESNQSPCAYKQTLHHLSWKPSPEVTLMFNF